MEPKSVEPWNTSLYLVRYQLTSAVQETENSRKQLLEVNREFGVNWVRNYESNDGIQIFSVYEAPSEAALRDQAVCLGLTITEVFPVVEVMPPTHIRRARKQELL